MYDDDSIGDDDDHDIGMDDNDYADDDEKAHKETYIIKCIDSNDADD